MSTQKFSPVVRAFLFNADGQILLTKHTEKSLWALPGGHVECDETIHDAIIREIAEEFGIRARFFEIDPEEILSHKWAPLHHLPTPISIYELSYQKSDGSDASRTEYIFLMETDETIRQIQTQEIASYKWFDPDEILTMKPNIDTWDFYIEMLENIIGEENFDE